MVGSPAAVQIRHGLGPCHIPSRQITYDEASLTQHGGDVAVKMAAPSDFPPHRRHSALPALHSFARSQAMLAEQQPSAWLHDSAHFLQGKNRLSDTAKRKGHYDCVEASRLSVDPVEVYRSHGYRNRDSCGPLFRKLLHLRRRVDAGDRGLLSGVVEGQVQSCADTDFENLTVSSGGLPRPELS